jgi:hypothetical protein
MPFAIVDLEVNLASVSFDNGRLHLLYFVWACVTDGRMIYDGLRLASEGQYKNGNQQGVPDGGGYAVERAVSHSHISLLFSIRNPNGFPSNFICSGVI